ncbi:MAG: Unknown protein [uncultured Thiotrichaceae bacterium]|uniref:DUF1840 domain-containing protein n=1 Tax=uncultured Thiotrichaceae bacterium TaxID=298394 RepID=A0A6S6TRE3_9GAMM|nr:MAG: Unknown protein [uncultured Thiotrichaceae bacterium]
MLVKFTSKSAASVSMFEKDAVRLMKLMGHSGTIPSAVRDKDVAEKLATLESALQGDLTDLVDDSAQSEDDEPPIPIDRRAYPLIELLRTAAATKENVSWDYASGAF